MLEQEIIAKNLDTLFKNAPSIKIGKEDKYVIFSDLHMGDGSRKDDFLHNSSLFSFVLENEYLNKDFKLILNGDVEELQRFSYSAISERWKSVYHLFDQFKAKYSLYKIVGNHDYTLILKTDKSSPYKHLNALVLEQNNNRLLVFHGHQASLFYTKHNALIGFFLKYLANPLGIKNYSVAYNSRKQFKIEKRVYKYSTSRKIASIIGHTHRPLFESLSKRDYLIYQIEKLLRSFSSLSSKDRLKTEKDLLDYKRQLITLNRNKKDSLLNHSLYNEDILVPSLFNSGCVIGRTGITSIEITSEEIALVHYFDKNVKQTEYADEIKVSRPVGDSNYHRVVINRESLDYIFTRIKFLA